MPNDITPGFSDQSVPSKPSNPKKAVILQDENSRPEIVERVREFCEKHNFEVTILDYNPTTLEQALKLVRIGKREESVCYIAGASKGNDKQLIKSVQELGRQVAESGYSTVYPGSRTGMMGVLAESVLKAGKPLVSVFSLEVAQAHIEETNQDSTTMVVAPNESVRQVLYHRLSSAQIALPGGTGTKTEASIHFYQNGVMGVIYPHPDHFGERNLISPIIYFSPSTKLVNERFRDQMMELYAKNPKVAQVIAKTPVKVGYWEAEAMQYKTLEQAGFMNPDYMALIKFSPTSEDLIHQLDLWRSDPAVRNMVVDKVNVHRGRARKSVEMIMPAHL